MRVGLVCPYSLDVPGGVQNHVRDLAEVLRSRGHAVSVFAPGEDRADLPDYVELAGKAVAVPYNGSVARLAFGPRTAARTRRWLRAGAFDVVHVHEPATPSLSLLALWAADGPVVATFHTANDRSRAMSSVGSLLRPSLEKVSGRIAVSEAARHTLARHLPGEPVVIPNGVHHATFATAEPRRQWQHPGPTVAFLGRVDEPRKGLDVALRAFESTLAVHPDARMLVAGHGGLDWVAHLTSALRARVEALGPLSDHDRASLLASADVYVAPQTGGESFGIVLVEAMAAGAAVVASDLPAFRAVLGDGLSGLLFAPGDAAALGRVLTRVLSDESKRAWLVAQAQREAKRFDWSQVVPDIEAVYATVVSPAAR